MQGRPVLPRQGVRLRAALTEEDQRCGPRRGGGHHHWEQVSHFFFYSIHCNENSKQIFPEKKSRGHSPKNSCVCERIPTVDLPILLQESHFFLYTAYTAPKIRNKNSQKRNCAATVPKIHVSVSEFPWSIFLFCCRKVTSSYTIHGKEPIPENRNKYSQKRNCARPQSQFPNSYVSVSDLYIPMINLPILLQESHFFLYSIPCKENLK
jgi:hypothetical protein